MDNRNYRLAVIYHSADLDGMMSGALAKMTSNILRSHIRYDVDIIGYNYGKDPKVDKWLDWNGERYDHYQFIDVTPPVEWLELVSAFVYDADSKWTPKFEIFDHHLSKFEQIAESERASRMLTTYSGMPPAMTYFFDANMSGALIYHDSLKDFSYWIDALIDAVGSSGYIEKGGLIRRVFPKHHIKSSIADMFAEWLYSRHIDDFVKMVSKFDTWQWYDEWSAAKPNSLELHAYEWRPLALNEWLSSHGRENYNMEWLFEKVFGKERAEWTPRGKNGIMLGTNIESFIERGKREIAKKLLEAKDKDYSFATILGVRCVMVFGHISFYEAENIMSESSKEPKSEGHGEHLLRLREAQCLCSYKLDFTKMLVKLSFRDIGRGFDCAKFAYEIGVDNGGGHFGSAGCRISMQRFHELITEQHKIS